ncbi:hypothetical protein O6H91_17G063500 [Diphasiastrum complanatum]|uniref:Uncharacterized protein n=1 Tax=Diphasiastrum complanatum TaxID=34168 RepID=A0ACC2B7J9_DIPCM|nr:hypothetical protein O6H91_17G063500 [Diphasiastrum complanatum]
MDDIKTHVTLRDLQESDVEDFMQWAADDEVTKHVSWETHKSNAETIDFISTIIKPHPWFKAICLDGTPIGSISLTPGSGIHCCRAELGYVLARKYWRKGITSQAARLAVSAAFDDLKLERVEALVEPTNVASKRVLEKAGLECVGLERRYILVKGSLRDSLLFSISSEKYKLSAA